jgi:hypothetical protein
MTAGIGGAVVAVPLVAVTNTVAGYLRAYSRESALRHSVRPRGATAMGPATQTPATQTPATQTPVVAQPPGAQPPPSGSPSE